MPNVVVFTGNMVRNPEFKATKTGTELVDFTIARNEKSSGEEGVSFVDVVAFKGTAKLVVDYVKKGDRISVTGRLKQQKWTSKDGKPMSKLCIYAEKLEFHTPKGSRPEEKATDYDSQQPENYGENQFSDENLPF